MNNQADQTCQAAALNLPDCNQPGEVLYSPKPDPANRVLLCIEHAKQQARAEYGSPEEA